MNAVNKFTPHSTGFSRNFNSRVIYVSEITASHMHTRYMFVKLRCILEPEEIREGVSECTYLAFCV